MPGERLDPHPGAERERDLERVDVLVGVHLHPDPLADVGRDVLELLLEPA
jgi:hypothetical protein